MRCKDIQLLIMDSAERKLSQKERFTVERHTARCEECRNFKRDLEKIQISLKKMPVPILPAALEEKTRLMCQAEIKARQKTEQKASAQMALGTIPIFIWGALIALVVLTVTILVPSIKEFTLDQAMSFSKAAVLTLIIQNAAMLIFAPIVVRKFRSQKERIGFMPQGSMEA